MKINVSKRDILWNYLGTATAIIINILILPLLIKFLNNQEIGLWYTYVGIGGMTALFDFGFAATLARNITYCVSGVSEIKGTGVSQSSNEIDNQLLGEVLGTCKAIYAGIAGMAVLLLVFFGIPYIEYITRNLNDNYIVSWLIYVLSIILNLYFCYYTSIIRGVGDIYRYNQAVVIARVCQIMIAVISLLAGYGILGLACSYLTYSIVFRIYSILIIKRYHSFLNTVKVRYKNSFKTFKAIWHNAWRDGIVSISNYFSTYALTIICSTFLSLEQSGIYSVSFQIANGVSTISSVLYSAYQPTMQSSFALNDITNLKKRYSFSMLTYFISYILISILVLTIGVPILHWIKPDYILDKVFLFFMLLEYMFVYYHTLNASFISCSNHIPYVKGFIISSSITVLFILIVVNLDSLNIGIWCIPLIQCIVQSCYNNWKWPYESLKMLGLDLQSFFNEGFNEIKNMVRSLL